MPNDTSELSDAALNRAIAEARGYVVVQRTSGWVTYDQNGHRERWTKEHQPSPDEAGAWQDTPQWSSNWQAAGELLCELITAHLTPFIVGFTVGHASARLLINSDWQRIYVEYAEHDGDPLKAAARAISLAWYAAHKAGLLSRGGVEGEGDAT